MSPLYEYKTIGQDTNLRSVCDMWNMAYNLNMEQTTYDMPTSIGRGLLVSSCISREIRIINYNINLYAPFEMWGVSRKPHFDMLFCLGESVHWELPESKKNFKLVAGKSYIGVSKETKKRCIFPREQNMHILEVKMPVLSLQGILEESGVNSSVYHRIISENETHNSYPILPSIQGILHQLLHCPYEAGLYRLYTEAKILELISVYLSEVVLQIDVPDFSSQLSLEDIKCVRLAKEILDSNMTNPPTIKLLSKRVGLNEYKLKKGFKELFRTPVHTYVIQRKLELAKLMLDSGTMNVSEAAGHAGYGNVSHFAAAFRKQYGINPGAYLKNIKN